MLALPVQIIDNFLLNFNIGQVLLFVFVLATLGVLPMKSRKLLGLHVLTFGLIFLLTPDSLMPVMYKFLGVALLFVGPFLVITGRR